MHSLDSLCNDALVRVISQLDDFAALDAAQRVSRRFYVLVSTNCQDMIAAQTRRREAECSSDQYTQKIETIVFGRRHAVNDGWSMRKLLDDEPTVSVWHCAGAKHRGGDQPAVVYGRREKHMTLTENCDEQANWMNSVRRQLDGRREWWWRGQRHRGGDQPAVVCASGQLEWWVHGHRHRSGGQPAVIGPDGMKIWYMDGERHRDGDDPAVDHAYLREWWKYGQLHRDGDKPARIDPNSRLWYMYGELHREGGRDAVEILEDESIMVHPTRYMYGQPY